MRPLLYDSLGKRELLSLRNDATQSLSLFLVATCAPFAFYIIVNCAVHLSSRVKKISLEALFLVSVGAEAYVTMRSQFNHSNKIRLINAAITSLSSAATIYCFAQDINANERCKLPMQGQREQVVIPGEQPNLPKRTWNSLRNWVSNWWLTVKLLSAVDKIRLGAGVLQLLVCLLDLAARIACALNHCKAKIYHYDISVIPLILAIACFAKRIFRQLEDNRQPAIVSCLILGDFARRGDDNPFGEPTTDLLQTIIRLPELVDLRAATKTFDMWNICLNTARRRVNFNMIELRNNICSIPHLPPADFVILCFSLINEHSFHEIEETWIRYLNARAQNIPIILVGRELNERNIILNNHLDQHFITRDQGYELAWRIKAIAYVECSAADNQSLLDLLEKIDEVAA